MVHYYEISKAFALALKQERKACKRLAFSLLGLYK